ncbi:DNA polymerase alpha subunit B [Cylas formicarius]|uniref:DNA polymerase alpha subunit B n=1 Tax=Cylas formicarius TaxID=197179 RepID=UPI00295870AF|nr:DNA polymerase alpha subunit B [Cylas formicarius]
MTSVEDILQQLQILNIEPPENVINKCLAICSNHNLGAEEFVEQWIAYTTSHLNGENPTLENLDKMERKVLQKGKDRKNQSMKNSAQTSQPPVSEDSSSVSINERAVYFSGLIETPDGNHRTGSRIDTPLHTKGLIDEVVDTTINSPGAQSGAYSKRTDAKSVKCSYRMSDVEFKRVERVEIIISKVQQHNLTEDAKYMYEVIGKKAQAINEMVDYVGQAILRKYGLHINDGYLKHNVGEVVTYGKIVSDSDGKINSQSVLLEGTITTNMGFVISLNLSKVLKYSLFPGQVVVVRGNCLPDLNKLVAHEIYAETDLSLPLEPPIVKDPFQIVMACGPFTVQNNLLFEPLNDLLQYVNEHKPHILLLVGPFFEKNNEGIFNGDLTQTFDTFFLNTVDTIMDSLKNTNVHVVMVSSPRDPHHHPVYPCPPYILREKYKNLSLMADPCMININGLVIGATSTDVLFHISNYEIFLDKTTSLSSDRMGRIAAHLLKQESFYPLDPPHKDMCIDHTFLERYGNMEVKPHMLILPSNLRNFVKNIDDCLVINPERLTKGYGGGTFARLEIQPGTSASICNRSICQILKI